ncbi:aspartate kinase [Coprinopsis marcescibilis]|uniref:aspartate kinase n=1 Tax=Coprinopsis marcescibilis TaxID=230819 RepID=A0A5C3L1S4_COPMA|nr:aspartate kinase [Coprinopsis marcescibilis]
MASPADTSSVESPASSSPGSSRSASYSPPRTPPNLHQNSINPSSKWLIQKFGGTSVGKFPTKIATDIVANYLDNNKVAIVCSARSGSTKALGTTSLLLKAASEALSPQPKSHLKSSSSDKVNCTTSSPGTGANTPTTSYRGLFGRTYHYGSDGSQSPPTSPKSQSRSSRSSSPQRNGLFGFTPINNSEAKKTNMPDFHATVDLIKEEHFKAARGSVRDPEILSELEEEIDRDCEWLRSYLYAAKIIDEISARSKDNIIGLGEKLACKLMAAVLRDQGIDAEYVSLDDIVPDSYLIDEAEHGGKILGQDFYDDLAKAMAQRLEQCGRRVPVVTGFFGPVPGSLLAQIGRGYTDLCSALLAAGLDATELQIWKEVDGIFTADPRKVPTARLIPVISPDEAAELTYYGSEVVHPFVMEQAIRRRIPIRIKNVDNPTGGGTVIHPDPDAESVHPLNGGDSQRASGAASPVPEPASPGTLNSYTVAHGGAPPSPSLLNRSLSSTRTSSVSSLNSSMLSALKQSPYGFDDPNNRRLPTAVTIKENILVINVHSNRKSVSHGFLAGIFGTLDKFGIVVDLISTSEVHVSMAIGDGMGKRVLDRLTNELRRSGAVSIHREMAILSLVGKQMRNMVGIAGKMFATLADGNVNIEMISQGASEINISCVIEARDSVKALNIIHQSCLMIRPEGPRGRIGPWLF